MMMNTPIPLTFLDSSRTAKIDTPEMTRRLNAALPTMVLGPNSPGVYPRFITVSMMERKISGDEEPRARRVRFATVGFHTKTFT